MPSAQEVDPLAVFRVQLCLLDLKHDANDIVSDVSESIYSDGGTNQSDSLDGLASELFVLFGVELSNLPDQKTNCVLEVRSEVLTNFLGDCAERRDGVLLDHRNTIFDKVAELGAEVLDVRVERVLRYVLAEIRQTSARVR